MNEVNVYMRKPVIKVIIFSVFLESVLLVDS